MKVLITGANGFVGQHLLNKLYNNKIEFVRHPESIKGKNKKFNKETNWTSSLKGITHVIHLAGIAHKSATKNEFTETNDLSTQNLVNQAYKMGVKKFIFLSSIKVLGENSSKKPFTEFDQPKPEDDYSMSKYEAEKKIIRTSIFNHRKYTIIRTPLIYGKGVKANMAYLIEIIKKYNFLPFSTFKNNRRNLLYIDNLVEFIMISLFSENTDNQIFHICDNESPSSFELVQEISNQFNKKYYFVRVPFFIFKFLFKISGKIKLFNKFAYSLEVDNSKAKKLTEWKPQTTFKEGIKKMMNT